MQKRRRKIVPVPKDHNSRKVPTLPQDRALLGSGLQRIAIPQRGPWEARPSTLSRAYSLKESKQVLLREATVQELTTKDWVSPTP